MNCPHLSESGFCKISSRLAGIPVKPWDKVCDTCSSCLAPQQENYVTASCAIHVHRASNPERALELTNELMPMLVVGRPESQLAHLKGPGTTLHNLLLSKGHKITPTCRCSSQMAKMNRLGIAWCETSEARQETVTIMVAEARDRKLILAIVAPEDLLASVAGRWYDEALVIYRRETGAKNEMGLRGNHM